MVRTDHTNLLYWKAAQKLNRRTARWHVELQDYNFVLEHVPGKLHVAADALSQPPGADKGKDDNQGVTLLPEPLFIKVADEDSPGSLEDHITIAQKHHQQTMNQWHQKGWIKPLGLEGAVIWKDPNLRLAIPPSLDIYQKMMNV